MPTNPGPIHVPVLARAGFAAVIALGLAVSSASAQLGKPKDKDKQPTVTQPKSLPGTPAKDPSNPKSFLDDVFRKGRSHDWILKVNIHLDSYQQDINRLPRPTSGGGPGAGTPIPTGTGTNQEALQFKPFNFETAAVIFPALAETAGSTAIGEPSATLKVDNRPVNGNPSFLDNMPCGSRYGKWDMVKIQGRAIDFDIDIPVSCWELQFDEARAARAIWPASGKWPRAAASCMTSQMGIDLAAPILNETVTSWCAGKPPTSIPPLQLAKFFAARVLETIQPSGDGLVSSKTGLLQGFQLQGVEQTLKTGRGSEHDIASTLAALYRTAGLPARVVIGYDESETKGSDVGLKRKRGGSLRSWVEFVLVDETVTTKTGEPAHIWVPVDVVRQRKSTSSRAPSLDRAWKFFGHNDETDDVIPIAFHYHPPTTVVAHGSPCFWGWITMPETQQGTEQMVRFNTITAPRTAPSRSGGR